MAEESKYCSDVMKTDFNKELVMNKKDVADSENSPKCWVCHSANVDVDNSKKSLLYHWKYRDSPHTDCNIKVKLNHKISVVFHNLQIYDSYLIMQELGKLNFKINVIQNA